MRPRPAASLVLCGILGLAAGCAGPAENAARREPAGGAAGEAAAGRPAFRLVARETSLGRPPHEIKDGKWVPSYDVAISPESLRLAWVEEDGDKYRVVVDGTAGRPYDSIGSEWFCGEEGIFGPGGARTCHFAYRDGHAYAVIDGQEGPPFGPACHLGLLRYSPDGRRVAYYAKRAGKEQVVIDGAAGPVYDLTLGFCFSPDGSRYAYLAKRGDQMLVVVDGKEGPAYAEASEPWFSPDSKRVAYGYRQKDGKCFSVVGDTVRGPFEAVAESHTFSADGRRVAFVAARGDRYLIVTDDGRLPLGERPLHDDIVLDMQFSPDGRRFGYVAARHDAKRRKYHVAVIDGVEGKEYAKICRREDWVSGRGHFEVGSDWATFERSGRLFFTSDGGHAAYVASDGALLSGNFYAVVDGKEFGPFDNLWDFEFSPDGRRMALAGWRGGKATLVLDGAEIGTFDHFGGYEFSPDGRRFGFTAWRGDRWVVSIDGKEAPGATDFWFLPDGRLMFGAGTSEADSHLVLDGREYPCVGSLRWSPDSKHLACVVRSGSGQAVAVDGKAGRKYDAADGVLYSPDGGRLAYFARRAGRWFPVVDGVEGPAYDEIVTYEEPGEPERRIQPAFDGPSRLRFLARRGDEVLRVEVEIAAG